MAIPENDEAARVNGDGGAERDEVLEHRVSGGETTVSRVGLVGVTLVNVIQVQEAANVGETKVELERTYRRIAQDKEAALRRGGGGGARR